MSTSSKKPAGKGSPASDGESKSLALQVVDKIVGLMSNGQLVAGQRLAEPDLCERFNVGRVPVREALRILAGDGVVEIVSGRGARMRSLGPMQLSDMLKVIVGLLWVALDEFPEVAEQPGVIDGLRKRLAAVDDALQQLDPYELTRAMCDYQLYLVACSNNAYLIDSMRKTHLNYYARQVVNYVPRADVTAISVFYRDITAALEKRDVKTAKTLFARARDHILAGLNAGR